MINEIKSLYRHKAGLCWWCGEDPNPMKSKIKDYAGDSVVAEIEYSCDKCGEVCDYYSYGWYESMSQKAQIEAEHPILNIGVSVFHKSCVIISNIAKHWRDVI